MFTRNLLKAILCVFIFATFVFAQKTDEELIRKYVDAVNKDSRKTLEQIIYPESLKYLKANSPKILETNIKKALSRKFPKKFYIEIKPFDHTNYDPDLKRYELENEYAFFPVNPTYSFTIKIENKDKTFELLASDVMVQQDGRWYIVWPIKFLPKDDAVRP